MCKCLQPLLLLVVILVVVVCCATDVQFAELAIDGLRESLLLYVHDQTNPNILQLLTSVSQLSDGVLVEVVLSGNHIQRVLSSVNDLGGVSVPSTHLFSTSCRSVCRMFNCFWTVVSALLPDCPVYCYFYSASVVLFFDE